MCSPVLRTVLCLLPLVVPAAGVDWPEWRGPGGQGHAGTNVHHLPTHWSESENIVWKCPLPGRAWSSPVIDGDSIWLSTALEMPATPEDTQRRLKANTSDQPLTLLAQVELRALCVDRQTGQLRHNLSLLTEVDPQWVHQLNSYASPTPVLEAGRAYFHFGTFGTVAVDTRSGAIVWTNRSLKIMHENGPGSSPILAGDLLVFHLDGSDTQSIVALKKSTGELAWRTPRSGKMADHPQLKKSYATPALVSLDGRPVLLSQGADWLYAYDPQDGHERWRWPYGSLGFSLSSRAVFGAGMMYLCTGYTRSELQAIQLPEGTNEVHRVWKYTKGAPTMSSPLLIGDALYFVGDSGGFLTCLDAATGAEIYRERLGGSHSASPLYADGHIYVSDQAGDTCVINPGRTLQVVARNPLPGKIMASPAAVGDSLYIRTDAALYRIADRTRTR